VTTSATSQDYPIGRHEIVVSAADTEAAARVHRMEPKLHLIPR
jgi:hypothetical protein